MRTFTTAALLTALYSTTTSAEPVSHCPNGNNDVCFQIAIPESSASSGSGNIYFQITAPDSYSWVALATGRGMSDSNMFMMYADGSGNVTISPRQASGNVMPTVADSGADLELLEGSGVSNGVMTANVRCSNCESWKSSTLDLAGTSTNWIAAWREGSAINSASVDARVSQHSETDSFTVDLTQATVTSDGNPFSGENASTGGDSSSGDSNTGSGSGSGSSGGGAVSQSESTLAPGSVLLAHGVGMTIAFVVLYPLGAILMPLLGKWLVHAVWQIVALLLMWAAFGLGVVYARDHGYLFKQSHTILGTVVVALITIQPLTGLVHHNHYKKHGGRNAVSHSHIWFGRIVLALGIINGGLGMQLASSSNAWVIAYSVIAALMTVLYIGAIVFKRMRSPRAERVLSGSESPREIRETRELK
ncbi:hypothetical protein B0T11DRAFT_69157 [Plectosphaerella cucumerina]|uniref:DOMON domain-containing protein n=1 Tax=Plectosphaerella cucumerina TaxID=40658 RepID=A0A8K0TMC6_9PEZI|nr:hypothetical protein B0T11DRAFT_69157 [Plectosphaerella cucumerina]